MNPANRRWCALVVLAAFWLNAATGAPIDGRSSWQGQWNRLDSSRPSGSSVKVEASSAAIILFSAAKIVEH